MKSLFDAIANHYIETLIFIGVIVWIAVMALGGSKPIAHDTKYSCELKENK